MKHPYAAVACERNNPERGDLRSRQLTSLEVVNCAIREASPAVVDYATAAGGRVIRTKSADQHSHAGGPFELRSDDDGRRIAFDGQHTQRSGAAESLAS
ncbi:MAG: hypothetical protein ACJA2W_000791 [Planctomycetota bacterium]|jgi:hypothetical protein